MNKSGVFSIGDDPNGRKSERKDYKSAIRDFKSVMKLPNFAFNTTPEFRIPKTEKDVMDMLSFYREIELVLRNLCKNILIVGLIRMLITSSDDILLKILPTQVAERIYHIYRKELARNRCKSRRGTIMFDYVYLRSNQFRRTISPAPRPYPHKHFTLINSPVDVELVEICAIVTKNVCLRKLIEQVKLPGMSFERRLESGVRKLINTLEKEITVTARERRTEFLNLREAQTVMSEMNIRIQLINDKLAEDEIKVNAKIDDLEKKLVVVKNDLEELKRQNNETLNNIVDKSRKEMGQDSYFSLQRLDVLAENSIIFQKQYLELEAGHISAETTKRVLMRKTKQRLDTLMTMCDNDLLEKQAEYDELLEKSDIIDSKYDNLYREFKEMAEAYEDCLLDIQKVSVDISESNLQSRQEPVEDQRFSMVTDHTFFSANTLQFDTSSLKDW